MKEADLVPVRGPEPRQCPAKARNACRLRRSKEVERADEVKASDLQSLVRPEAQPEQREQHHGRLSRAHRGSSKNVVASQRDDPARSQIARKAG